MTFENRKSSLVADIHQRDNLEKKSMRHKKSNLLNTLQIAGDDEDIVSLGNEIEELEVKLEGIPEAPTEDHNYKSHDETETKQLTLKKFIKLIYKAPDT